MVIKDSKYISKLPNFFIVGFPRSGTTSMYEYLKDHPQIFMSPVKEPGYFAKDVMSPKGAILDFGEYSKLFRDVKREKIIGEASTPYIDSKVAALEIKKHSPDAKILIMIRNPVDMMYSLYKFRHNRGIEKSESFAEALSLEDLRKKKPVKIHIQNSYEIDCTYRQAVDYIPKIKRYFDAFGRKNVMIIVLEEFNKSPSEIFKKILNFLEIDNSYSPSLEVVHNKSDEVPKIRFVVDIYNFLYEKLPRNFVNRIRAMVPVHSIHKIIFFFKKKNHEESKDEMSSYLKNKLHKEFTPKIKKLEEFIGKDLHIWPKM